VKQHQALFEKIKVLLRKHFKKTLQSHQNGSYLTIGDTGVWVNCDDNGLSIGFGSSSKHYDPEFENLSDAIERLYYLLTKRKRIRLYLKGGHQFKNTLEIEVEENEFLEIHKAQTWLYPYWQKTVLKEMVEDKLISEDRILKGVSALQESLN